MLVIVNIKKKTLQIVLNKIALFNGKTHLRVGNPISLTKFAVECQSTI